MLAITIIVFFFAFVVSVTFVVKCIFYVCQCQLLAAGKLTSVDGLNLKHLYLIPVLWTLFYTLLHFQ